jgi:hypothetical protein
MTDLGPLEAIKLAIFYASYLYFPAALFLGVVIARRQGVKRVLAALALAGLSVPAYARFVEPRILTTAEQDVRLSRCFPEAGEIRAVVFSDTHIGLFGNAMPIARIARRAAKLEPDLALIPGDFTYFLSPEKFSPRFAALAEIGAPVFAVLGNHDVGLPGPDVAESLSASLGALGVVMLDDKAAAIEVGGGAEIELVGLSDLWLRRQDRKLLERRGDRPRLVLTHNPNTALEILPRQAVDLMIAGHTHGGQIRIPGLTCLLFRSMCHVTVAGLAETARGPVFVTTGTGMVGLPMRLGVPPRIDVLSVSWSKCAAADATPPMKG